MSRRATLHSTRDAPAAVGSNDHYLKMVGERVRDARARHGMSRRMLAHDSGISERYLAELESGRGNLSIVLMRRLAKAIDLPVAQLVDDDAPRPIEYQLLSERIRRLG
ncbi:MAG TPA: helix-turn-helix domain-containing protein, partial [Candidatus Binataceae bacterium]|nr:helix-turn-helix domain-containing protein [Candidatus Binataceae bacterium]